MLSVVFTAMISFSKGCRATSAKGKVHGVKSGLDQAQVSKTPFPVESHRTRLISPVASCNNTYEVLSTREAC